MAVSPFLTRLYGLPDFAVFALFLATTSILALVATGRYEVAILLPASDDDARDVMRLSISLVAVVSVTILLMVLVIDLVGWNLPYQSQWIYFVPMMVLLLGVYQSLNYWLNRIRRYRQLAVNRILRALLGVIVMLWLGVRGTAGNGLVLGTVVGQLGALLFLLRSSRIVGQHRALRLSPLLLVARRYRRFPLFSLPGDAVNALTQQMPVFLLGAYFEPKVVGAYGFSQRVLAGPSGVVATAIGDVFRQRAGYDVAHTGSCRELWLSTFRTLALLSVVPFALLAAVAPSLFEVVFGQQWRIAGEYAQLLTPFFFLGFTASILGRTMYVVEKQKEDMAWQFVLIGLVTLALVMGSVAGSAKLAILLFSLTYSGMYLAYIWMSYRYSGGQSLWGGRLPGKKPNA